MKIVTVSIYETEDGTTRSAVFPYGNDAPNVDVWVVAHDLKRTEQTDEIYWHLTRANRTEEVNGVSLHKGDL